jgi:hypothetical protein
MLAGMDLDVAHRFWSDLLGRLHGPETFRFFLQPIMAILIAWRDGTRDAKLGRKPYLWGLLRGDTRATRKEKVFEGIGSVGRVLILGVIMDMIYQWRMFGGFHYPVETIVMATVLAFVPYMLFRGPIARLQQRRLARKGNAS